MTTSKAGSEYHLDWCTTVVDGQVAGYGVAGEGKPLVFLHGWGLGQHAYKRALKRLVAQRLRVYAPSMPSFGGTPDLPAAERSLEGYARWVDRFLTAVDVREPVTLVGHSFGGGVAIRTAYDFPARVDRLVLINSIGGSAWAHGGALRSMSERPLWDWGLHLQTDLLPWRQLTRVVPVILEDAVPNLLRNPRGFLRVAGIARTADLVGELEELKRRRLPIVLLWGRNDTVIPPSSFAAMSAVLGDADVVTVDGSHSWLLRDPKAFAEVMTNVLGITHAA
jgi:pimeloyl-ACP methyl ester carboxylesterase